MPKSFARRLSFIAALTMVPCGALAQTADHPAPVRRSALRVNSDAIETLVSRVMPSVVQVIVSGYRPAGSSQEQGAGVLLRRQRSMGSGVVVSTDGHILTNAHVVNGGERIRVVLSAGSASSDEPQVARANERELDARILGVSEELDLALLQVEAHGLHPLPFADYATLRQGELVLAFGNPDALRNSVSMGVVSAVAQQTDASSTVWIQTDAAVNPGNSGGPLVNADGELVGINTFIRSASGGSEGLGFAVPSAVIATAYPQLRDFGHVHRARLGIIAESLTPQLRRALRLSTDAGVIVADVAPGGPAGDAGLRPGDIVTAVGGQSLATLSLARFNAFLMTLADGQRVTVTLVRGSQQMTLTVTATVPPHVCERTEPVDTRGNLVERLGLIAAPVDAYLAQALPTLRAPTGIVVVARVETPHVPEVSLARGDVIHSVNGTAVTTLGELRASLDAVAPGDPLVLHVERSGVLTYLVSEAD